MRSDLVEEGALVKLRQNVGKFPEGTLCRVESWTSEYPGFLTHGKRCTLVFNCGTKRRLVHSRLLASISPLEMLARQAQF